MSDDRRARLMTYDDVANEITAMLTTIHVQEGHVPAVAVSKQVISTAAAFITARDNPKKPAACCTSLALRRSS
jgi:hypothetical protein